MTAPQYPYTASPEPWNKYIGMPPQAFEASPYGQVVAVNDQFSIETLTGYQLLACPTIGGKKWALQVAGIWFIRDDNQECLFDMYDLIADEQTVCRPEGVVGITWSGVENVTSKGELGIQWPTEQQAWYIPQGVGFPAFQEGGYLATPLSLTIPAESCKFGLTKQYEGQPHTPCRIAWLFAPIRENYPVRS